MKRSLILVSVTLFLVWSSVGQAASSIDVLLGSVSADGDVTWGDYLSGTWAIAGNDSLSQEAFDLLPQADTLSEAAVSGADAAATARTQERLVQAQAWATTGPGSSAAYAYADQQIWFMAAGGALRFDTGYSIAQSLSSAWNETAFADASVGLGLYREDGTLIDEAPSVYVWNFVAGGDSFSDEFSDILSVSGSFDPQEIGYLWARVDGQATAAVIPAPGAILLGMIGTGLVGFLKRRVL